MEITKRTQLVGNVWGCTRCGARTGTEDDPRGRACTPVMHTDNAQMETNDDGERQPRISRMIRDYDNNGFGTADGRG